MQITEKVKKLWQAMTSERAIRIIEVLVLGIITAFTSCAANKLANTANKLAEKTNELAEIQIAIQMHDAAPVFSVNEVIMDLSEDMEAEPNVQSVIQVEAISGKCVNVRTKVITFLVFKNDIKNAPFFDEYRINLVGLYDGLVSGYNTGVICNYISPLYNRYESVRKAVLAKAQKEGYSGYIELERYISISYVDIMGNECTDYYSVDQIRQQKLDEETGMSIFSSYNEKSSSIPIWDLTYEKLLEFVA